MLSRPSECNSRTLTDVKLYAEKAAFEGQAPRSMINGLQTRTKCKLSQETSQFAERCYEERLVFYVCEALLVCVKNSEGRMEAGRILRAIQNGGQESELRAVWSPLLESCSDALRELRLESSKIRLSKLSDLWKKRSDHTELLQIVNDLIQFELNGDEPNVNTCRARLLGVNYHQNTGRAVSGEKSQTEMVEEDVTDFVLDIYVMGNIIYRHLTEVSRNLETLKSDKYCEFYKRWPTSVQKVISQNELNVFMKECRNKHNKDKEYSLLSIHTKNLVRKQSCNFTIPPSCEQSIKRDLEKFIDAFLKSITLSIDIDYLIGVRVGDRNQKLIVQLTQESNVEFGMKQFIELRHGCTITPYTFHRNPQEKSSEPTPAASPRSKRHYPYLTLAPAKIDPVAAAIKAKYDLHRQIDRLVRYAQIVHVLREPLGASSPLDMCCNGFTDYIRDRINDSLRLVNEIEKRLNPNDYSKWPAPNESVLKMLARSYGVSDTKLRTFVNDVRLKSYQLPIKCTDLVTRLRDAVSSPDEATHRWQLYVTHGKIVNPTEMFALSPEAIGDATHLLPHLQQVNFGATFAQNYAQCSDRFLDDCTFYSCNPACDKDALKSISGVTEEFFATPANMLSNNDPVEYALRNSFQKYSPVFMYPRRTYHRLARDLARFAFVPCRDQGDFCPGAYENLQLPFIYNSHLTQEVFRARNSAETLLEIQSAMSEFGSPVWMKWAASNINHTISIDNNQAISIDRMLSLYRRTIAEREACKRDEQLIARLRVALIQQTQPCTSNLDAIRMDGFVNDVIERINRGERLVQIDPPFNDATTADKLARFIRSKRMPPTRDESSPFKYRI
ncbi:hypothetical protein PFISCL1PPCAC_18634 [Pristionchus fissidentatus]|uniref:Uncharacterized protein n=1 Tax=Pristionchus fissidentatus TaxID=1538716 RepID=A0AAV5W676_9BILA|nr:hypothetical protein PFISCL1PPCAC_18634 [Pristionchus fissidentatus]